MRQKVVEKTKCPTCKGYGTIVRKNISTNTISTIVCPDCDGSGIPLRTSIENQFEEASEWDGSNIHQDESNYIDFEEEDYEV